jgi:hypothetical protein
MDMNIAERMTESSEYIDGVPYLAGDEETLQHRIWEQFEAADHVERELDGYSVVIFPSGES